MQTKYLLDKTLDRYITSSPTTVVVDEKLYLTTRMIYIGYHDLLFGKGSVLDIV